MPRKSRTLAFAVIGGVGALLALGALVQYPNYKRAKRDYELRVREVGVGQALSAEVAKGDGTRLDLGSLVNVPWDRVFILPPYTPFEFAQRGMPGPWYLSDHAGLDARDDICVLAFFDHQKLTARVSLPRGPGDFAGANKPGGYSRAEAVFFLERGRVVHCMSSPRPVLKQSA